MNNMKLREIRKSWGVSQREMAIMIGCPMRTYQNWEYGINKIPFWLPWMISSLEMARAGL